MECSIINTAPSLLMKHLVIGRHQKAPNFSAFQWSPHGSLVSIGQHFVTKRVVHLPKRTETSLINHGSTFTEKDRNKLNQSPNRTRLCGSCIAAIAGSVMNAAAGVIPTALSALGYRQSLCNHSTTHKYIIWS